MIRANIKSLAKGLPDEDVVAISDALENPEFGFEREEGEEPHTHVQRYMEQLQKHRLDEARAIMFVIFDLVNSSTAVINACRHLGDEYMRGWFETFRFGQPQVIDVNSSDEQPLAA